MVRCYYTVGKSSTHLDGFMVSTGRAGLGVCKENCVCVYFSPALKLPDPEREVRKSKNDGDE